MPVAVSHSAGPDGFEEHTFSTLPQPLKPGTALKAPFSEFTPVIGREYSNVQLADLLVADDSSNFIRDVAYVVSSRGVVFFRNQEITPEQMKDFVVRLSTLSGSPLSSTLHIHPLTEPNTAKGDHISIISSVKQAKGGGLTHQLSDVSRFASAGWHSDITFERLPSDYAMLKIHTLPETGGDTLWASGYEIYDRLSPPMRTFLEGLTATHGGEWLKEEARNLGMENGVRVGERGSPWNSGDELTAVHPVVRSNPVTGWKSVFVNKGFTQRINGVTKDESDVLLAYLFNLVTQNHDAQVRFKWNKNDVALWDNRSTLHCATYDYTAERAGDRVCSIGEKPRLDPQSKSRKEALATAAGRN